MKVPSAGAAALWCGGAAVAAATSAASTADASVGSNLAIVGDGGSTASGLLRRRGDVSSPQLVSSTAVVRGVVGRGSAGRGGSRDGGVAGRGPRPPPRRLMMMMKAMPSGGSGMKSCKGSGRGNVGAAMTSRGKGRKGCPTPPPPTAPPTTTPSAPPSTAVPSQRPSSSRAPSASPNCPSGGQGRGRGCF